MVYTTEISFSQKVNIGNYEIIELSQSIHLDEEDKEREAEHFANLILSVNKRIKFLVKSFGRENDTKVYTKLIEDNKDKIKPSKSSNTPVQQVILPPPPVVMVPAQALEPVNIVKSNIVLTDAQDLNDFLNLDDYNPNIKSPKGDINNILDIQIPEI